MMQATIEIELAANRHGWDAVTDDAYHRADRPVTAVWLAIAHAARNRTPPPITAEPWERPEPPVRQTTSAIPRGNLLYGLISLEANRAVERAADPENAAALTIVRAQDGRPIALVVIATADIKDTTNLVRDVVNGLDELTGGP